ncbi:MAG: helix-turn-helix domain-containing protein [Saprospiraceae bacterium]
MKNIFFPDIAREIRLLKGIALKPTAAVLGICLRTLSRVECGKAPFLAGYLPPLAECYGIEPVDFFHFNLSTKCFEQPALAEHARLKQEVEALRAQVRQLSDFIHHLQKEAGAGGGGAENWIVPASSKRRGRDDMVR